MTMVMFCLFDFPCLCVFSPQQWQSQRLVPIGVLFDHIVCPSWRWLRECGCARQSLGRVRLNKLTAGQAPLARVSMSYRLGRRRSVEKCLLQVRSK